MDEIPRERFVSPAAKALAYIDQDLPVSDGADRRFMLSPMVQARLIQALEIDPGDEGARCGLRPRLFLGDPVPSSAPR